MAASTFTLTGTYRQFDNTPATGYVDILPSAKFVKDTSGDLILAGPRVRTKLDEAGSFSIDLPDPNDPTLQPSEFGYTVVARLGHSHPPAITFGPSSITGPTVSVEDLTPIDVSTLTPTVHYATMGDVADGDAVTLAAASAYSDAKVGALTKASVGLGNVDNTADSAKPVSTVQAAADAAVQSAAAADATSKANAAQAAAIAAAATDASTKANAAQSAATSAAVQRSNHTGTQSADTLTDGSTNKAYTATERTKLSGVATGATVNSSDATLLDRANHTGTQAATTITGLAAVATSGAKADIGLGSVDNTSDANKPVSTAQAAAISVKADASALTSEVSRATAAEGANATLINNHKADTANPHAVTKVQVGLSNVENLDTAGIVASSTARAARMGRWQVPAGGFAMTIPRWAANSSITWAASGQLRLNAIYLCAGDVVTSITFMTGATAGSGLTNRWAALYDSSLNLIRQSANDTSAAWAATTAQAYTLSSTYTVPTSGWYYIGLMVAGTTIPSFSGATTNQTGANMIPPVAAGLSTTGLTSTAPSTAAALSGVNGQPLVWVS